MTTDPIAELRSATGSLISLYAQRPAPGGFGALLADLLRPIRAKADQADRGLAKSVRADIDRIRELAERLESEAAPAYAIFASDRDGLFVVEALAHDAPDVARVGPRPYLRPLRVAPRELRSGVLVADRVVARVFVVTGSMVDELGEEIHADPGKADFGGFSGYDEHAARQRATEATARLWRSAGQRLLEAHQRRSLDYVALGGQYEILDDLARSLHPYLARLPRVNFPAVPATVTRQAIRAEVAGYDIEVRRDREAALAGRVCDIAWSGGNAVLGLSATLDAANVQAIDTLVVAGEFERPGATCLQCDHLLRNGETCPVCGSRMVAVEDVVASIIEVVVATGGRAHQVEVAHPLDSHGVGALTRFPVPG